MAIRAATDEFVGREAELSRLRKCAAGAQQGQPWVVLIEGEAGVGKSALLRQWLGEPGFEGFIVLRASADMWEQDLAMGVVGQLLRGVPRRIVEGYPLLSQGAATAAPFQVGMQFLALVGRLQTDRPVALVVDDVQWADEESMRALGLVVRRLEADQVLTVLVARTGQDELTQIRRLATDREWSYHLVMEGLASREVAELAERMLQHAVEEKAAERLRHHTNGNALYVSTLLTEFPDESLAPGRDLLPVPSSLAGAVAQQLAGLPETTRRLVEAAAVLDTPSSLALVAQVAQISDSVKALEPALEAGLLRWWPNEPTTPVAVNHALQTDVIMTMISPPRRRALHAAAAPLVDQVASWSHRVAASEHHDERLAEELESEAQQQAEAGAVQRAATLLVWASDLTGTRAEHERLLLTAAARLAWADKFAQIEPLLPGIRSCAPSALRSLALGAYAMSCGTDSAAEAEMELTRAFTTAASSPALSWIAAMAGFGLGWLYLNQSRYEESVSKFRQVLALDKPGEDVVYRTASRLASSRGALDGPQAALEEFVRITHAVQVDESTPPGAYMLAIRGWLQTWNGTEELTKAVQDLTTALQLSRSMGYPVAEEYAYAHLAYAQYWLGQWDDAAINADHAITISTTDNRPWGFPLAYMAASLVPSGRGQWERAGHLVRRAKHWARANGQYFEPYALIGEAVLAQAKGDYHGILNALAPLAQAPERGVPLRLRAWWQPLYVEALTGTGKLDEAAHAVAALCRLSQEAHPHLRTSAAWLSGWLAHCCGDLTRARTHYEESLALTETSGQKLPLRQALLEEAYGRLLTDQPGRQDMGLRWLHQAHHHFTQLGAAPFAARCTTDLITAGAPRPTSRTYLTALTDRERDIAHLVSKGLTNKEVGRELFISTKTVEYHLGHIYAKLDIINRRQLRDRVRRQAPA